MKTVCKKLFSLLLVAVLLVSAIPFQASAALIEVDLQIKLTDSVVYNVKSAINCGALPIKDHLPSSSELTKEYVKRFSDEMEFQHWVFETGVNAGEKVDTSRVVSKDMADGNGVVIVKAVFGHPKKTITLDAKGGTISTTSIKVVKGDVYPELPTPTRDGYTFIGWYTEKTDKLVGWGTPVECYDNLIAKWSAGSLPVVFQKWNSTDKKWEEADRRSADTGKSLRDSGKSLPAQDATKYNLPRPGYEVDKDYPWVDANGNVFTVDTVVNAVTYVRPNFKAKEYTITYNFNCTDLSNETQKVTFDSKLTLKKPTVAGHVFLGWLYVPDNNKEVKDGDTYVWTSDIELTAVWAKKGSVELRVYRDDTDGFKTYYYSSAIKDGELDLNNCKIQDYLKGTYEFDGWFNYDNWVEYLGTRETKGVEYASNAITRIDKVKTSTEDSNVTVIYGMVKGYKTTNGNNATTGNNNNNVNTGTPDPSNPKTGDTIMIAVTTMTMAAAALVAMYELKKRKMI